MKTIKVSEENWSKVMRQRVNLHLKSNDEVIGLLFKLIQKCKLGIELRDLSNSFVKLNNKGAGKVNPQKNTSTSSSIHN